MAVTYGFRKIKVFEAVPANTLIQVDEMFGVAGFGYFDVINVNANAALKLTVNTNVNGGQPGVSIPIPGATYNLPAYVTNFKANDVVTVIAYGN